MTCTESDPFPITDFVRSKSGTTVDDSWAYENLDHAFFETEIEKLIKLRTIVE